MKKNLLFLSIIGLFLISCHSKKENQNNTPKSYKVLEISIDKGEITAEFPTTVQSSQVIEIRPKVEGYLEKIYVNEGTKVKQGQPLFLINTDIYQQEVNAAKAAVATAEANLDNAKLEVIKITPLVQQDIVSDYQLRSALSNQKAAEAQLNQAKSQLAQAQINLSYTCISAPVSGLISKITIRKGTLIKISDTEPMSTIAAEGNVYAYFSISEKSLNLFQENRVNSNTKLKTTLPKVKLRLANGNIYKTEGVLELASGIVDPQTGTLSIKAVFSNPDYQLTTGLSGTVLIPHYMDSVIKIPMAATYEILNKKLVWIFQADSTITQKEIIIYGNDDKNYIVESGLKPHDIIVTEGISLLKEGQKIIPVFNK